MRRAIGIGLLSLWLASTGCDGSATDPVGYWPLYALDDTAGLYTHPWPSDIVSPPGTRVQLNGFPNPLQLETLDEMIEMVPETRTGAGLTAGLALRFADKPDLSDWPQTPGSSADASSPAQLLELTPDALVPVPFDWRYLDEHGPYHPSELLRVVPAIGRPLKPATRYAFIIKLGHGVTRSPQMQALLRNEGFAAPLAATAQHHLGPVLSILAAHGQPAHELAFVQVFTTDDPAQPLHNTVADVVERFAPVDVINLAMTRDESDFCLLEGDLGMPQFQAGTSPFFLGQGHWVVADNGQLVEQNRMSVPFSIVIPKGNMPTSGWPLVIYIHGTSGYSTQVIDRGPSPPLPGHDAAIGGGYLTTKNRGPGYVLARRGIASAGSALPVNPQRDPQAVGWGIYNFRFPKALRDNFRQGVVEQALFLRSITQLKIDPTLCPGVQLPGSGDYIRFATDRIGGMGQSLGAIELGLWAPVEPKLQAVVPSGAGGHYPVMLTTSSTIPGEVVLRLLSSLNPGEVLDQLHPLSLLIQMAFEPVDPVALARRLSVEPLDAIAPKHVYAPAGYLDGFFHPASINALMGPLGVGFAGDTVESSLPTLLKTLGRARLAYPVQGNATQPEITRLVVQFPEHGPLDGHHVSYQRPEPKHQFSCFFRTFFDGGTPTIPAPVTAEAPCD